MKKSILALCMIAVMSISATYAQLENQVNKVTFIATGDIPEEFTASFYLGYSNDDDECDEMLKEEIEITDLVTQVVANANTGAYFGYAYFTMIEVIAISDEFCFDTSVSSGNGEWDNVTLGDFTMDILVSLDASGEVRVELFNITD